MRIRWPIMLALAALALLLAGCAAEMALGGVEVAGLGETAVVEGAAEAGLAEGVGLRVAAGVGEAAEVAGLEGSEGLGLTTRGLSVRAGALRPVLAELRNTGSTLGIDMAGQISRAGRYLATLEGDGAIVVERGGAGRFLVGKLGEGRIWQVAGDGSFEAVGELRGFVPGRGIRLRSSPSPFAATVEILRPNLTAEVVGYRGGWFEVRLLNGERGYLWSPFVAVTMVLGGSRREDDRRGQTGDGGRSDTCSLLTTGRLLRGSVVESNEGAVAFAVAGGDRLIVDRDLCQSANDAPDRSAWDWSRRSSQAVLSSGGLLFVKAHAEEEGVAVLELPDGTRILSDPSLIKGFVDPETVNPSTPETRLAQAPRETGDAEPRADATGEEPSGAPAGGAVGEPQGPGAPPAPPGPAAGDRGPGRLSADVPFVGREGWTPDREWIRYLNRQRILLLYSAENSQVVHQVEARLRRLGASVVVEHYSPQDPDYVNCVSYWAQRSELGPTIRDALSGLVTLRLAPEPTPQRDAVWLR